MKIVRLPGDEAIDAALVSEMLGGPWAGLRRCRLLENGSLQARFPRDSDRAAYAQSSAIKPRTRRNSRRLPVISVRASLLA